MECSFRIGLNRISLTTWPGKLNTMGWRRQLSQGRSINEASKANEAGNGRAIPSPERSAMISTPTDSNLPHLIGGVQSLGIGIDAVRFIKQSYQRHNMVNDRTIITELGFCLGLLNHDNSYTMPQIDGMDESHWQQLMRVQPNPKFQEIYNLSQKQGRIFGNILARIESINWVANAHSRFGKQIDIVVNDSIMISLKHDSDILYNPGPDLLFNRNLNENIPKTNGLWMLRMAKLEYEEFYHQAILETGIVGFPTDVRNLTSDQGYKLRKSMPSGQWKRDYPLLPYYQAMNDRVSFESAQVWNEMNQNNADCTKLFFNLFRLMEEEEYYLIGRSRRIKSEFMLRVMSRREWLSRFEIVAFPPKTCRAGRSRLGIYDSGSQLNA